MKKGKIVSIILSTTILAGLFTGCGAKQANAQDAVTQQTQTKEQDTQTETTENKTTEENSQSTEKEPVTVRLADMSVYGIAIFNYANEIGLLDGYFDDIEDYDVSVELSEWASGVDQNTAYAAGQIDFSSMGNIPAVSGASNGFGTKIIAVNYLYDNEYVLVAREGSGIETVADLKGKNVGTYVGTVTHYAIAKYLENVGLSVNDVNLLNVAAEVTTSLRNGDIDAGILGNVVAHQVEEEGAGYILAEDSVPIYNYVVGRTEFTEKYPEITVRVLQLINDTWDYALEHQQDYIEFYAGVSGTEVATVEASWKDNFPIKSAKDFDEADYEAYIAFVDWMKSVEYVNADVNADDLLDLSYVKQLEK